MSRLHTDWPLSKIHASIALRQAVGYYRDWKAFKQGDKARFNRMVDNSGKAFPNCTPAEWERRIRETAQDANVRVYFQRRCDRLLRKVGQ